MAVVPVRIEGTSIQDGAVLEAEVRSHHEGTHRGLVVLTDPLIEFSPKNNAFLNDVYGSALNQNISFSGTPEIIHNGGTSTEWTGSAIQGAWNFADSGKVSLTGANNNDEAEFTEETPTTIDLSGYTTLTGKINLTTYSGANNTLSIAFDNAGTPVGNSVLIDDYIDAGIIGTEQTFVIPKADMGLTTQLVDGFRITLNRTGGAKPTMTFDDIQFEETGDSAVFTSSTPINTTYHIHALRFSFVDNISGIVTVAGATENATHAGLSYNQILGVSKLTNGIILQLTQKGERVFSENLKQLGDFLSAGANVVDTMSDGTNTCVTIDLPFNKDIVLTGNGSDNSITITINDNLSGLLTFTATAIGALEV